MGYTVEKVLEVARKYIGYKEKETNSQLDDFNANAGDGNYTMFARELHKANYYQANKNGYAWCDVYHDYVHYEASGYNKELAEWTTCQTGLYGAGCEWSAKYYKQQGRFYTSNPQPGDQIFFQDYAHTGIVEKVTATQVTTIEGNTGNQVKRHTYSINSSKIDGYGRPKYDVAPAEPDMTENENYYRCKKGVVTQLSKNFKSTEFDCKCNGYCNQTTISKQLLKYLQQIRDHFGKAVNINSGYRCETHNKNVGGVTNSYHRSGEAADITVTGITPKVVAQYAESIGILGIGLYETDKDGYFVHVDIRKTKSFWYGQAQTKRDTFQDKPVEEPKPVTPSTLTVNDFKVGEIVEFIGDTHYTNASAKTGKKTVPGLAKVTATYRNGTHQLHLRAINKNGNFVSGVYGWVNVSDVKKSENREPQIGDIVNFTGNTHYVSSNASNGKSTKPGKAKITAIFKNGKHPIHLRAVNANGGFTSGVYGWVNTEDVELI